MLNQMVTMLQRQVQQDTPAINDNIECLFNTNDNHVEWITYFKGQLADVNPPQCTMKIELPDFYDV